MRKKERALINKLLWRLEQFAHCVAELPTPELHYIYSNYPDYEDLQQHVWEELALRGELERLKWPC